MKALMVLVYIFFLLYFPIPIVSANDHNNSNAEADSIFTMSIWNTELELNPLYSYSALEQQIYSAIYEGLVSYDPQTLRPIPASAERWEILEEGRVYRFYIHPNAYYSNGDKLESEHFREAWLRMLELGEDAPFGFLLDPIVNAVEYRAGTISDRSLVGITAPDPNILEVRLNSPISYFLVILAHQSMVSIHPSQLGVRDWNSIDQLIGNGPYALVGSRSESGRSESDHSDGSRSEEDSPNGSDSAYPNNEDETLELIRNSYYWDSENSDYDRIHIRFTTNSERTREQLNASEIQWIYNGLDTLFLYSPSAIQVFPQFSTSYYFFTTQQEPFNDERVRRALLLLLPVNEIRSGYTFPTSVLVPQIPGYPDISGIIRSDQERAFELLDQAGYPNGANLPIIRIHLLEGSENQRIAEIMESAWEEALGINVEVQYRNFSEYQNSLRTERFTIGGVSWIGDYADPLAFLQLWKSDSTLNTAGFRNAEFDEILENSNELDFEMRYEQLALAEELLLESGIVLPVNHGLSVHIIDLQKVGGWYANILDIHPFKYLREQDAQPPQAPPGVTLAPANRQ